MYIVRVINANPVTIGDINLPNLTQPDLSKNVYSYSYDTNTWSGTLAIKQLISVTSPTTQVSIGNVTMGITNIMPFSPGTIYAPAAYNPIIGIANNTVADITTKDINWSVIADSPNGNAYNRTSVYGLVAGSGFEYDISNDSNNPYSKYLSASLTEEEVKKHPYSTITTENVTIKQHLSGINWAQNIGLMARQFSRTQVVPAGHITIGGNLNIDLKEGKEIMGILVSGNISNLDNAQHPNPDTNISTLKTGLEAHTPIVILKGKDNRITLQRTNTYFYRTNAYELLSKGLLVESKSNELPENFLSGLPTESYAIQLGSIDYPFNYYGSNLGKQKQVFSFAGRGILQSEGSLIINTTRDPYSGGIKIIRNSLLIADNKNASTEIHTNGYALQIGGYDNLMPNYSNQDRVKRSIAGYTVKIQAASHNVSASFRNAIFTTTGTSLAPRWLYYNIDRDYYQETGKYRYLAYYYNFTPLPHKDLIFVDQGQVGTKISFSGEKTNLAANSEGYILNVSGNYHNTYLKGPETFFETPIRFIYNSDTYTQKDNKIIEGDIFQFEGSSVTFNATDAGSMTGLVNKGLIKSAEGQFNNGFLKDYTKWDSPEVPDPRSKPILNLNLSNGFTWNLQKNTDKFEGIIDTLTMSDEMPNGAPIKANEARFDNLTLASNAMVNAAFDANGENNFILSGNISSDSGIINLNNAGKYNDILTINGNYEGLGNALITMNTLWLSPADDKGSNSQSDKLIITGTATGETTVIPVSAGGRVNVIDGDNQRIRATTTVPVIEVQTAGKKAFKGLIKTTGVNEVQLAQRTIDGKDEYFWTVTGVDPIPEPEPEDKPIPTPKPDPKPIYDPSIAGYVNMLRVNLEQSMSTIATYHERRGESPTFTNDTSDKGQSWARIYGKHLSLNGQQRLDFKANTYGLQLGYDFLVKRGQNGSRNLTGAYFAYNRANTKFYDQYRHQDGIVQFDKYTGKGDAEMYSLGLTNTYYAANKAYFDLVGQVSWLHNKYQARDMHKSINQDGWGAAFSAEIGHPFALSQSPTNETGWFIEPQAQLIYQFIEMDNFNDGYRIVKQGTQDNLRGRVGVRLTYNTENQNTLKNTFYTVANVWHDFIKPDNIKVGYDKVSEKYASTWGELGIGMQMPITKQTYLYSDVRYEHTLSGTKRSGYKGNLGIKFSWK